MCIITGSAIAHNKWNTIQPKNLYLYAALSGSNTLITFIAGLHNKMYDIKTPLTQKAMM